MSADLVAVDVELGVHVSERDLDGFTYAVRDLPRRLRCLGEEAFRAGYRAAVLAERPDTGSEAFGRLVEEVAGDVLFRATAGWTTDERERPWRYRR